MSTKRAPYFAHWDYRVLRSEDPDGTAVYEIREVYYNADGFPDGHCSASALSEDRGGLLQVMAMMAEAIAKPTLDRANLEQIDQGRILSDQLTALLKRTIDGAEIDEAREATKP
jgi:hypothetical protein